MRTRRTTPVSGSCARHSERPAATACDDCGASMCTRCAIDIEHLGTFCWSCAARRGGLHQRPRPLPARAAEERAEPVIPAAQPSLSVQLFESMVADREPRPLISGLTERLAEAGADPEDIVDDEELIQDIGRLHDLAAAPDEEKGWRHRS